MTLLVNGDSHMAYQILHFVLFQSRIQRCFLLLGFEKSTFGITQSLRFFEGFISIKSIKKSMGEYVLRPSEYERLRAQEPRMRGFVVFAPEDNVLVSQGIIPRKQSDSILGNLDAGDVEIYAKIAELERKYVPFWRAASGQDFANMVEVFSATRFINAFIFMEGDMPRLYKMKKKAGITSAVPLELKLLVAAEHAVR